MRGCRRRRLRCCSFSADTFGAKFTSIFAVQDSISERVASALVPKLTEDYNFRTKHLPGS